MKEDAMTVDAPLPPPPVKVAEPTRDELLEHMTAEQVGIAMGKEPDPDNTAAGHAEWGDQAATMYNKMHPAATRAVQAYRSEGVGLKFSPKDQELIYDVMKRSLTQGSGGDISQAEFDYFLAVCSIRGLNPLLREAHLLKTGDGINVQVGIDGFRSLAEETGQYAGQTAPEYEYAPRTEYQITVLDGREWAKVDWSGRPIYAKVGVYRTGSVEPFWGESWIEEDFNGNIRTGMWVRRPHTMLAKVAEARAHRKAFPRSLSGIYAEGELSDALPVLIGEGSGGSTTAAQEAPGAPEGAEEVTEGEFRVPEAPRPPEGGVAGELVKVDPEAAYRSVKIAWRADTEVHQKVELKFTVPGKGKLTAVVLDELAVAVAEAELKAGERVWVDDTKIVPREWGKPEDKKPPIKELHNVGAVRVYRDSEWRDITAAATAEGEETEAEAAVEPEAAPLPPAPPAEPTLIALTDGQVVQTIGVITRIEWREDKDNARRVVVMAVQVSGPDEAKLFYRCAMEEAEAKEQLVDRAGAWLFAVGEKVAIMGAGAGGWLALTAVRAAP